MAKTRADVVRIINEQILKKITWCDDWDGIYYKPLELHKMIIDFCRKYKTTPSKLKCDVDHFGRLYINDKYIDHIATIDNKYRKLGYDEKASYWEGKILARQENYYND